MAGGERARWPGRHGAGPSTHHHKPAGPGAADQALIGGLTVLGGWRLGWFWFCQKEEVERGLWAMRPRLVVAACGLSGPACAHTLSVATLEGVWVGACAPRARSRVPR